MSTECWLLLLLQLLQLLLLLLLMQAGFFYPPGTAQSNGAGLAILAGGGTRATQIPTIILRARGASKLYCARFNRKPPSTTHIRRGNLPLRRSFLAQVFLAQAFLTQGFLAQVFCGRKKPKATVHLRHA